MKLLDDPVNADSLAALGADAVQLLCVGDIDTLATRYGYALSDGREPATAIREDLRGCLSKIGATSLTTAPQPSVPRVAFYKPNSSNGAAVLVELIVTTDGTAKHITLEDLTAS
jgi:hypothetical protein